MILLSIQNIVNFPKAVIKLLKIKIQKEVMYIGFDWENILDAEGEDIAEAYEDAVYEATVYEENHRMPDEYWND